MTRNKTPHRRPASPAKTRAVYEVKPQQGKAQQVEATTPAELAAHLARVLGTDPQDSRAAAHVLHVTRATITAAKWSARRVGVLKFHPDEQAKPSSGDESHPDGADGASL